MIIGIIVSAPMGPVGLLCLKETLLKGKKDGLLTGLGAALSDTLYGSISYLSVGIVLSFIEDHQSGVTLIGSLLLFIVGYYLYKTVPKKLDLTEDQKIGSLNGLRKVTTAFFITLSNPLIIFFFLSLYSRFYFISPDENFKFWIFFISILSIFFGCISWWYFLSHYVSKIRGHLRWEYVRRFNHVLAIIIASISVIGVFSSVYNIINGAPF